MKRIFTRFTVEGLNLDRLIGTLSRRGIRLYRMRKINRKTLKFSLKNEDKQKFFAIMENMCYNVTETGEYGLGRIPALLGRHPGAVLGVFLLAFSLFFGDAVMTGVQFDHGDTHAMLVDAPGHVDFSAEAERTLEECGVRPFTFFAAYDRDELERLLLKNPHFSFASVKKEGNRLVVELALADEETPLFGEKKALVSPVAGEIEYVKLYQGSALVSPGDRVERGALLIEGKVLSGEEELEVSVLGEVGILVTDTAKIYAENEEDARALFLARPDRDYITVTVKKTEDGFEAAGVYRRVLYGGKD